MCSLFTFDRMCSLIDQKNVSGPRESMRWLGLGSRLRALGPPWGHVCGYGGGNGDNIFC
jgi:hypothetical protein